MKAIEENSKRMRTNDSTDRLPDINQSRTYDAESVLTADGRTSAISSGQRKKKLKPPLDSSPSKRILDQNQDKKLIGKGKLGRVDQLKFKMAMQCKSLRTLTQQNDLMDEIYREEKGNYSKLTKRNNNIFQN